MKPLLSALAGEPWMILPGALAALGRMLCSPGRNASQLFEHEDAAGGSVVYTVDADGVATIPIYGTLARQTDAFTRAAFGMVETPDVVLAIERTVADSSVKALVLDIDSPGGLAVGMPEAAQAVRAAASRKPIVAFTSGTMASAAYYLGAMSSEIVASKSASLGSIGTIVTWLDFSEGMQREGIRREVFTDGSPFKTIGLPGLSMTAEQRDYMQRRIEQIGRFFRDDVKASRRFIRDGAMRGQMFLAEEAVERGLAGAVGGFDRAKALALRKAG